MYIVLLLLVFIITIILTGLIRQQALKNQILDIPNHRSSHQRPTPKGGGLAFVLTFSIASLILMFTTDISPEVLGAIVGGGVIVAIVGYLDDLHDMPIVYRVGLHALAALFGLVVMGGMPPLNLGFVVWEWGWLGHLVGFMGLVWMINLYNFMDGIDGIATSQAIFVSLVGGILLQLSGGVDLATISLLLTVACFGFLVWNWPPAKIFMGDAGSGFLGYILGILAISSFDSRVSPWVWLTLLGVFVVDTLVTLVTRILDGHKWYKAHRTHTYQHLTIRWQSHLRVTSAVIGVNVFWLLPLAWAAWVWPHLGLAFAVIALVPLVLVAIHYGAGREASEVRPAVRVPLRTPAPSAAVLQREAKEPEQVIG